MTSTDYLHFAESFFKDCIELSRKKTADYTGNGADAFANFRQIPENWTEIGFLTRMGDKMARLRSFVQNGDLQVKDESATDTLRDLANYCALLAAYLGEQKKGQGQEKRKIKTVKVISCQNTKEWWYGEYIGWVFDVKQENKTRYLVQKPNGNYGGIEKSDCEIIPNPATNP